MKRYSFFPVLAKTRCAAEAATPARDRLQSTGACVCAPPYPDRNLITDNPRSNQRSYSSYIRHPSSSLSLTHTVLDIGQFYTLIFLIEIAIL